jgi:hypothetical protein
LGVERLIGSKVAAKVRYVGSHTVGNFQTINGNPRIGNLAAFFPELVPAGFTPCTTAGTPGVTGGRIDCDFANLRIRNNGAWGIYHGLQSSLDIQNWHNLTTGIAWTWSRGQDNVSEIFATAAGGNTNALAQNPFDPNVAERGLTGNSFKHVASIYWIYDLPWYRSQQGVLGHLLGGWQVNGAWRYQSGQPFSVAQFTGWNAFCDESFAVNFIGFNSCRPILFNPAAPLESVGICDDPTCATATNNDTGATGVPSDFHWLINDTNASLFLGTPFGGSGRNILRGQTIDNLDFSIFKNTKVTERLTVQFRAEVFNLFNREFLGNPGVFADAGSINLDPGFGGPGDFLNLAFNTSNRRFMQFGLRFVF